MINKIITNHFKIFKNIPVVVLNKEIIYINHPAKSLLHYTSQNKDKLSKEIIKAIKNKKFQIEIEYKGKIININLQCDTLVINNERVNICILNNLSEISAYKSELEEKLSLYEEMFYQLPIGILIHENGYTKYINEYGMKVLEVKSKKEYLNFPVIKFLLNDKDKQRAVKRIQSKENYLPPDIYEIKSFKGRRKIVELYSYFFPFDNINNSIVRLLVFIDKTEEIEKQKLEIQTQIKEYENKILIQQNKEKETILKELHNKQEQLFNTINQSDYLFWITDADLNILLYNDIFYNYCKKYYNINIKVGDNTVLLQKKMNQYEEESYQIRKKVIDELLKKPKEVSYEITHFDNELKKNRVYKITFKPILGKHKKLKHYYCYGHEITEKYEFLNQIEQQSVKLKEIIEHSPIYLWSMNIHQEITLFNKNYERLIEQLYGQKPIIGKKLSKGKYAENKEIIETLNYHYNKAFKGSHENFKLNFEINPDQQITLDVNLFPIVINNEIKEVSGITIDITQEIEKQKQLQNLLTENEILIKEVHHRIKNNLQVISSMINLQIQQLHDNYTKSILQDTQNRVLSMANIHQSLYQNKNYTSINFSNNILSLVQNILYSFNKTDIIIHPDIDEIILDVNTAIPVALIINESITNIAKYAFPESFTNEKRIDIVFKRNLQNIELSIKDNGVGISAEQINNPTSVGFSIIHALSNQINAQLFIHSQPNQGTEIKLLIPHF